MTATTSRSATGTTTADGLPDAAPADVAPDVSPDSAVPAPRLPGAEVVQDVATRVGVELGAELGKEVRESALLLGMALVVVGLFAALASTALLIG